MIFEYSSYIIQLVQTNMELIAVTYINKDPKEILYKMLSILTSNKLVIIQLYQISKNINLVTSYFYNVDYLVRYYMKNIFNTLKSREQSEIQINIDKFNHIMNDYDFNSVNEEEMITLINNAYYSVFYMIVFVFSINDILNQLKKINFTQYVFHSFTKKDTYENSIKMNHYNMFLLFQM